MLKNFSKYFLLVFSILSASSQYSQLVKVSFSEQNSFVISVDAQTHIDYGLSYPLTYVFTMPQNANNLRSHVKFKNNSDWSLLTEKTSSEFFNGEEVVRFDYVNAKAYVSVGFSDLSDSIYIRIDNAFGENINFLFDGISQYYDNRDAVVTSTADDWASWNNENFIETCQIFRSYNLWLSCAIITGDLNLNHWSDIQNQLDSGFVEVVSHSRTHPHTPYENLESEVLGSKQDLIENLVLPSHNSYGIREYIYAWVAPYGEYDNEIDIMVSLAKYLIPRMYYGDNHDFSAWEQELYKYAPVGVSTEFGPLWLGTTDINILNTTFDEVLDAGGIYHVMCHPNIIEWEEEYPWNHLEYISNKNNIWYVGFGHLYLYHFLSSTYPTMDISSLSDSRIVPGNIILNQNFPNPFNGQTIINFSLYNNSNINVNIFDYRGHLLKSMLNINMQRGNHSLEWDATNTFGNKVSSGVYIYTIDDGITRVVKKMILNK